MTMEGDEPIQFDWEALVPYVVHPLKVAIIEALRRIGEPLSASELERIFLGVFGLSLVSYHLTKLAGMGAVEKVRTRHVRGAVQTFYFFPPAGPGHTDQET